MPRMNKPAIADVMPKTEKRGAAEAALAAGMAPAEVFTAVVQDYYGVAERRGLVVHWGRIMHVPPSAALRIAQDADLIPPTRLTPARPQEKPPHKSVPETSE